MPIYLVALATLLLLVILYTVFLSVWMVICGCGWTSSLSLLRMGTSVLVFKNNAPSSASDTDDIRLWIIVDRLSTALLFGGFYLSLDRK